MKTWRPALHFFVLLLVVALSTAAGSENPQGESSAANVEVRLSEYTVDMPHTLPAGPTTFLLRNEGQKSHSFKIEGPGIEDAPSVIVRPGKTDSLQVTLQPGEYKVYCPLGSHAAKGMTMKLVVSQK
jgi:uncharacterized cupredoxin-like copper-binding protein